MFVTETFEQHNRRSAEGGECRLVGAGTIEEGGVPRSNSLRTTARAPQD